MGARILIAEDDQIIAADVRLKAQGLGYEVVGSASAGEEAIVMAEQLKPEIVLMDVQLETSLNGAEAARRIQESTGASILFVTAFPSAGFDGESSGTRGGGEEKGDGVYLGKPFSRIQLEAALDAALRRRSQRHGS